MTHSHGESAAETTEQPQLSPEQQAEKNIADLREWAQGSDETPGVYSSDDYFMFGGGILNLEDTLSICDDHVSHLPLDTSKGTVARMYAAALREFGTTDDKGRETFDTQLPSFLAAHEKGQEMLLGRRQKKLGEQAVGATTQE